jgi:hypothetical protein
VVTTGRKTWKTLRGKWEAVWLVRGSRYDEGKMNAAGEICGRSEVKLKGGIPPLLEVLAGSE